MNRSSLLRPLAALLIFSLSLSATFAADQPPAKPAPDPSLLPVEDVAGLPRVLLIGDSISMGYTIPVRQLLAGKANVHRIPANGSMTREGLAHLTDWVGGQKWDVIHFNWGLHDLKLMPDGKQQVPLAEYEANLRELVNRLRPLANKLIWCSTTPVPGTDLNPPRRNEDVIAYNAVAQRVMEESGIPTDDLYNFVLPQADTIRKPINVHYTPKGYTVLAQQVAKCIQEALPTPGTATTR